MYVPRWLFRPPTGLCYWRCVSQRDFAKYLYSGATGRLQATIFRVPTGELNARRKAMLLLPMGAIIDDSRMLSMMLGANRPA